jgi:hypothetical protein
MEDHRMKRSVRGWVVAVIGFALITVVAAQDAKPSGTVVMESKSVAAGIGVTWGDGTLTYEGKPHKFTLSGLSVVDLGISKVAAKGNVFNLKKLEDFSGTYVAAEAAATIGEGAGGVAMKNQHGVVIRVTSTSQGVQLTLAAKGVDIKLQ